MSPVSKPAGAPKSLVGKTVAGRFQLRARLGQGELGITYLSHDQLAKENVAVKVIRSEYLATGEVVAKIIQVVSAAQKLTHPAAIPIRAFGDADGNGFYVAMDMVPGQSLARFLAKHSTVTPAMAIKVVLQLLELQDTAQAAGVFHGDIKPGNIIVEFKAEEPVAHLFDFGIAHAVYEAGLLDPNPYMSPELVTGTGPLSMQADVFSMAAVLYKSITGQAPFGEAGGDELRQALASSEPAPLRQVGLGSQVPEAVEAAVMKALQKDPAQRHASAAEFRQQLGAAFGQEAAGAAAYDPSAGRAPTAPPATRPPAPQAKPSQMTAPEATGPAISELEGLVLDGLYELGACIVGDAWSSDYEATDDEDKPCLVTVFRPAPEYADAVADVFETELALAEEMGHPRLRPPVGRGRTPDGTFYVVYGQPPGDNLMKALEEFHQLPSTIAVPIAVQIVAILAQVHSRGLAHGSLRASRVFINVPDTEPEVYLHGLGLAKIEQATRGGAGVADVDSRSLSTYPLRYYPPEQLRGKLTVRSDQYSLAVLTIEMLCGQAPFEEANAEQQINLIETRTPPSMRQLRPDLSLPTQLNLTLNRALAKRPEERHSSPIEFATELQEGLGGRAPQVADMIASVETEAAEPVSPPPAPAAASPVPPPPAPVAASPVPSSPVPVAASPVPSPPMPVAASPIPAPPVPAADSPVPAATPSSSQELSHAVSMDPPAPQSAAMAAGPSAYGQVQQPAIGTRRAVALLVSLLVLLLVGGGAYYFMFLKPGRAFAVLYREAEQLLAKGDIAGAKDKLTELKTLKPRDIRLLGLLRQIVFGETLASVRGLMEQQSYEKAREELDEIPEPNLSPAERAELAMVYKQLLIAAIDEGAAEEHGEIVAWAELAQKKGIELPPEIQLKVKDARQQLNLAELMAAGEKCDFAAARSLLEKISSQTLSEMVREDFKAARRTAGRSLIACAVKQLKQYDAQNLDRDKFDEAWKKWQEADRWAAISGDAAELGNLKKRLQPIGYDLYKEQVRDAIAKHEKDKAGMALQWLRELARPDQKTELNSLIAQLEELIRLDRFNFYVAFLTEAKARRAGRPPFKALKFYEAYIQTYPEGKQRKRAEKKRALLAKEMESAPGLMLDTKPMGADLEFAGRDYGMTPQFIPADELVPGQTYGVVLRLEGYQDHQEQVTYAGKQQTLFVPLSLVEERVRVKVTTAGRPKVPLAGVEVKAVLLRNDAPPRIYKTAKTPDDGVVSWPLQIGRYDIEVSARGYTRRKKPLVVEAGRTASVSFALVRAPGMLEITAADAGRALWLNGKRLDKPTPPKGRKLRLTLKEGEYMVVVETPAKARYHFKLKIEAGATVPLHIDEKKLVTEERETFADIGRKPQVNETQQVAVLEELAAFITKYPEGLTIEEAVNLRGRLAGRLAGRWLSAVQPPRYQAVVELLAPLVDSVRAKSIKMALWDLLKDAYVGLKNLPRALEVFDNLIEFDPDEEEKYILAKVQLYMDMGPIEKARALLDDNVLLTHRASYISAQVHERQGNLIKATQDMNEAIDLAASLVEYYRYRGRLYVSVAAKRKSDDPKREQQLQAAEADATRAVDLARKQGQPADIQAACLYELGKVHYEARNLAQARTDVEQAIRLSDRGWRYHGLLGDILLEQRQYTGALGSFSKAIGRAQGADQMQMYCRKGDVLRKLKEFSKARAAYNFVYRRNKRILCARAGLARVYKNTHRNILAVRHFKWCADHDLKNPEWCREIAQLYTRRGRRNEAAEWMEEYRKRLQKYRQP